LQAGCPSCRPTNSVKALKAHNSRISTKLQLLAAHFSEFVAKIKVITRRYISSTRQPAPLRARVN